MSKRSIFSLLALLSILAASAASVSAQVSTVTIHGTVSDSTGAVIPNAQVTAVNTETNFSRSVTSDSSGGYAIQFLPIGPYRLEVTASGFKKFVQSGIVLEVSRNARVDPVLAAGAITETVSVTSDAPLVETNNVALGQTTTNADIVNLPLVNRDLYTLLELTAGVDTTENSNIFGSPAQSTIVNGSANSGAGSVNYYLDGGSNTNGLRNTGNSLPNPDAVQEFRVITNSYSAEYGRFAGGVVDLVTKSGTNQWRGSLFEFIRNDALNANRWTPGVSVLGKEVLRRNQFGGSFGGPLIRDKTFFFTSYSGLRQRRPVFSNDGEPTTADERKGIFPGRIRDPQKSGACTAADQTACFPNNTIPVSRFDPVAVRLLNEFIPLPNLPDGLYEAQQTRPLDTDEIQFKLDHALSGAHQLMGSYFYQKGKDVERLRGDLPWVDREFTWRQHNLNLGDTWTISPTMINQFRITYVRLFGGRLNTPEKSLGDFGSKFNLQGPKTLPQIEIAGRLTLGVAIGGPVGGSNLYQIRDVFSWTRGNHSLKFGGEASLEKLIQDTTLNNYGVFRFNSNNARGTGNAMADFLLGLPLNFNQDAPITKIDSGWYTGLFVQDDFKIHPRLTLNLGLRYDLQLPLKDPLDRKLTFIQGRQSRVVPNAFPGMLFPGDEGIGRGIAPADRNNFAPRIGLAWDPFGDGRTAVRAAFGVFYGTIGGNMWNGTADNQPFSIRQRFNTPGTLSDPYSTLPGGVSPFPYSYSPNSIRFILPAAIGGHSLDFRMPYVYQMNLTVQKQLTNDLGVTAAYVGSLGHKFRLNRDLNYPVFRAGATTGNVDARRPILPGQLSAIRNTESVLNNAYHGMQLTAEKRFARNFSFKAFYTFGKSLDTADSQDDTAGDVQDMNNIAGERGRTEFDRRHNFVLSGIWRGNYFNNWHPAARAILNGWSLSAIVSLRSGRPLTITNGSDANLDGNSNDRANLAGNPVLDHNRQRSEVVAAWFNTAAFAQTPVGTQGTAGRNIIDGPGLKNVDLGVFRDFNFTERFKLQFRAEATNAFNLVNLNNPTTSRNSSQFGR
ncbi:MAG: carboxypeptidase regulatory-like domain-containing protein, partial [Blastocatellia bacterium]